MEEADTDRPLGEEVIMAEEGTHRAGDTEIAGTGD